LLNTVSHDVIHYLSLIIKMIYVYFPYDNRYALFVARVVLSAKVQNKNA
jgi:hypothetical protein